MPTFTSTQDSTSSCPQVDTINEEAVDQCSGLSTTHSKHSDKEMEEQDLDRAKNQIKSLKAEVENLKYKLEKLKASKKEDQEMYKMKINELCEEMQRYKEETSSMKKIIEEQKALLLYRHVNERKYNERKNVESVQIQTSFEQDRIVLNKLQNRHLSADSCPLMEWQACSGNNIIGSDEKMEYSYGTRPNASITTSIMPSKASALSLPTASRNPEHLPQIPQVAQQSCMFSKPYHSTPASVVNSYFIPKKPTPRLKLPLATTTEQKRFLNFNFIAVPRQSVPPAAMTVPKDRFMNVMFKGNSVVSSNLCSLK